MELKVTRDRLSKYQKKSAADAVALTGKARDLLREGKRDRAATALRVKKLKEREVARVDAQLTKLAEMLTSVESAQLTAQVVEGLKAGNEELRRLNAQMPVEEVRAVLDEADAHRERLDEINQLIAESLDPAADAEAASELERLQDEVALHSHAAMPEAPVGPVRVGVPAQAVPAAEADAEAASADRDRGRVALPA